MDVQLNSENLIIHWHLSVHISLKRQELKHSRKALYKLNMFPYLQVVQIIFTLETERMSL